MQEQSYKNEGGIKVIFEKHITENHTPQSDMLHHEQLQTTNGCSISGSILKLRYRAVLVEHLDRQR